jgi:hypothetical protein
MNVLFSGQNTGACPLCKKWKECNILKMINGSVKNLGSTEKDDVLEVVIYRCPYFEE